MIPAMLLLLAGLQDPAVPRTNELPLEVIFRDGLRFRTHDGDFEARLGGRMLAQYRHVADRPDDATPADGLRTIPNSMAIRQARIELEGSLAKEFAYRVQTDFATGLYNQPAGTGPATGSATLRDAWIEWTMSPEFKARFGQYFSPVSQEDATALRNVDFAERSAINRLHAARELGFQVSGSLLDRGLEYALMVSNGTGLLNDQGRDLPDSNDEKELAGQLRCRPFVGTDGLLKELRLGVGGSAGSVDDVPAAGYDLVSTELSVLWLSSTSADRFDGPRVRAAPQFSWAWGPVSIRGEYLYRSDELASGSAIRSRGGYLQATWVVTGEEKKVEDRVVPAGRWGALELGLRGAALDIDGATRLAPGGGDADGMRSLTLGLAWWVKRNVRLMINGIFERYDDEIAFDRGGDDDLAGLIFRAQVDF